MPSYLYLIVRRCLLLLFVCGLVSSRPGICASSSEHSLEVTKEGEAVVEVSARVAAPSWRNATELARLRLFLDDEYRQDVLLVPAGNLFKYQTVVGRVEEGAHLLRLEQHGCSAGVFRISVPWLAVWRGFPRPWNPPR